MTDSRTGGSVTSVPTVATKTNHEGKAEEERSGGRGKEKRGEAEEKQAAGPSNVGS